MGIALALLSLIGLIALLWHDSMRSREAATAACRSACRSYDAQFLDDTVSLAHLGLIRTESHGLRIRRVYQFEITYDGTLRHAGSVTLVGHVVQTLFVPGSPAVLES